MRPGRGIAERNQASRRRVIQRQRRLALSVLVGAVGTVTLIVALATRAPPRPRHRALAANTVEPASASASATAAAGAHVGVKRPASPPFAVGLRVLRLVDASRAIDLPNGTAEPRTLLTYVRYPTLGAPGRADLPNAPAARSDGPFPLIVFGHGFAVTPSPYAQILRSWARAGYVVAAPLFPLESANAPGGPNESDLINQPADMGFVISSMLAASSAGAGPFAGLVASARIAVAGQSDGGDTALAVAYNRSFRDPRVSAAAILSGAEIPGVGGFTFPRGSPPLLATQGTADTVNPPSFTSAFFDAARRPKYRLNLLGAEHLPPYTDEQPQLGIVERVTIAFFDAYLKRRPGALQRLLQSGSVPGTASVLAGP